MSGNFGSKRRNVWPRKFSSKRYYGKRPIISHDLQPGFNLAGKDRSRMSYGWQFNGQSTNHEPFYCFPQPSYADVPTPQLRSFEELQVERSYLINCLQREDSKATELLKKIRHLQDTSHGATDGSVHRKLKRQLGHFKSRMCQSTKQEKMILARLGQVTYEIQSKERWSRVENERLQQWNCHGFEQMRLDGTCPEFIPYNAYSQQGQTKPAYDGCYYGGYTQPMPSYGGVPEWRTPTTHCELNELHELPCVVNSTPSTRVRSASMDNLALPTEKVKRLSMPELFMEDSKGDDSIGDDHQYIGYYVSKPAK